MFAEKRETYELAECIGIPVPRTRYPRSVEELGTLDLEYPARRQAADARPLLLADEAQGAARR